MKSAVSPETRDHFPGFLSAAPQAASGPRVVGPGAASPLCGGEVCLPGASLRFGRWRRSPEARLCVSAPSEGPLGAAKEPRLVLVRTDRLRGLGSLGLKV